MTVRYNRILLKLSGEALAGGKSGGFDDATLSYVASEIKELTTSGVQIAVVVGGGNIFRGMPAEGKGFDRSAADDIGMLATCINSLMVRAVLVAAGVPAVVMSAFSMDKVAELFVKETAESYLSAGQVVIIAGGTGNPFFTTDTAAALRCAELGCQVLLKATKVDGIYSDDPVKNPSAQRYTEISYRDAIDRNLKVMDMTAFSFCMEQEIPIIVFKFSERGNLRKAVDGVAVGTIVKKEQRSV